MSKKVMPIVAVALALGACQSVPDMDGSAARETAIPFVSKSIVEWKVAGERALLVKAINGQWYDVRTSVNCPRLRTAVSLGFVTAALDQLDRNGAIIAERQRCPVSSVTRTDPPAGEPGR